MDKKFTKGKWSMGEYTHSVWGENKKGCIADCNAKHRKDFYEGFTAQEMNANALLISKAPEMLEMLKEITHRVEMIRSEPSGFVRETMIDLLDLDVEQLLKEATEL